MTRDATAGDIERCAVVNGAADDRQAESDVHATLEPVHLDGDMPLVVILRHHDIELTAGGPPEDRVRRPWSGHLQPLSAGALDGRADGPEFLIAEHAAFARVRVQARDGDPRPLEAEAAQAIVRDLDRAVFILLRHPLDRLAERNVDAVVDDPQLLRYEEHGNPWAAGDRTQDLRVARVGDTGH